MDDQTILSVAFKDGSYHFKALAEMVKDPEVRKYLDHRYPDSDSTKETIKRMHYGIEHKPTCPMCGKPLKFIGKSAKMFAYFCSLHCSNSSKDTIEKKKETQFRHFGTRNCYDSSLYQDELEKKKGYRYNTQNKDAIEKRKKTLLAHYGTTKIYAVPSVRAKMIKTNLDKFGCCSAMQNEKVKQKHNESCRLSSKYGTSKPEQKIRDFIRSIWPDMVYHYCKDSRYPFSCDFYLPSKDLFIEYQGSQYHHFHAFDPNSAEDLEEAARLKAKAEAKSYHNQYECMLNTWTKRDPAKREAARKSKINYLELWTCDEDKIREEIEKFKNLK